MHDAAVRIHLEAGYLKAEELIYCLVCLSAMVFVMYRRTITVYIDKAVGLARQPLSCSPDDKWGILLVKLPACIAEVGILVFPLK